MIVGLIPARGGSKGLPRKNVLPICGKPLIAWTIEAAKNSRHLDDFYVTTEDEEIARVASEYGAKVILRPEELAQDQSNIMDVIKHAIEQVPMETVVLLQPTTPQRDSELIDQCIERFQETQADNLATGLLSHSYEYGARTPNRQESSGYFCPDGAVFLVRGELVTDSPVTELRKGIKLGDKTEFVFTDEELHYDIDTPFQFWVVEQILKRKLPEQSED